jgi:hypothetical protein
LKNRRIQQLTAEGQSKLLTTEEPLVWVFLKRPEQGCADALRKVKHEPARRQGFLFAVHSQEFAPTAVLKQAVPGKHFMCDQSKSILVRSPVTSKAGSLFRGGVGQRERKFLPNPSHWALVPIQ